MSDTEASSEPEEVPDDFPLFYAQQVMVGTSFYDLSLVFIQDSFKGSRPVAGITLPPAAAKHLAHLLNENVRAYEEQMGEIALPPEPEPEAED